MIVSQLQVYNFEDDFYTDETGNYVTEFRIDCVLEKFTDTEAENTGRGERTVKGCIFETVTGCGKGNEFREEFENITDSDELSCI